MNITSRTKKKLTTGTRVLLGGLAVLIVIAAEPEPACAQRPFQDASGKSGSVFIDRGGFAQFNIATGSLRLGYLYEVNPNTWAIGFDVSGKLAGSKAGIFSENQIAPDAQFSVSIGKKYLLSTRFDPSVPATLEKIKKAQEEAIAAGIKPSDDLGEYWTALPFDRLSVQFGYAYKQYSLIDSSTLFDKQLTKKDFHSPSASLNYFIQLNGRSILGATFGVERSNNSNKLTEVEVRDIVNTVDGSTMREVSRVRKALRGGYTESPRTFLHTDYVWFPKQLGSRIGLNLYTRSGLNGDEKGVRPGLGVFISEPGKPTRVIGGVSISYERGKANIALLAGFNF